MRFKSTILIYLLITSLIAKPSEDGMPILEVTIGKNYPTGSYDKYADNGFSARFSYSRQFINNEYFRWQVGFQYIHFDSDKSTTSFLLENGDQGPTIDLTRRERGLLINAGMRYSMNRGVVKNGGYFRPYVGGYVGLANFRDATFYDWGDNDCFTFDNFIIDLIFDRLDCYGDNNGNQSKTVHDKMTKPFYSIEFGTNIHFPKTESSGIGMDMGIRYNMISGLSRSETLYDQSNDEISTLSRRLQANYYTLYIGVFIMFRNYNGGSKPNKTLNPGYGI